jgi:hypothetical protein
MTLFGNATNRVLHPEKRGHIKDLQTLMIINIFIYSNNRRMV